MEVGSLEEKIYDEFVNNDWEYKEDEESINEFNLGVRQEFDQLATGERKELHFEKGHRIFEKLYEEYTKNNYISVERVEEELLDYTLVILKNKK